MPNWTTVTYLPTYNIKVTKKSHSIRFVMLADCVRYGYRKKIKRCWNFKRNGIFCIHYKKAQKMYSTKMWNQLRLSKLTITALRYRKMRRYSPAGKSFFFVSWIEFRHFSCCISIYMGSIEILVILVSHFEHSFQI